MAKRKSVLFLLKLLFSAAVLAFFFLLTRTSLKDIGLKLRGVSWGWLALAFSLQGPGLLISAHRWRILARAQGDDVPLLFLVKSYLVGMFFNNFLPTRFGGDVVRIWDGSKYSKSLVKSSAVVLVDRATGIIVLFLFALVAALFRLDMAREVPVIWAALVLGLIGLAGVVFFFLPLFGRWLRKIPERGFLKPFKQKVIDFRTTIILYKNKRKEFSLATAWAVLLQMNVILFYFLIGRALHLAIPLLDYFIFIPLVLLIQIIPITINGLGLREGAYIEIFKFYGIPAASAWSFSIIEVAFGLILGLIGGAIYVSRK
ncbi:MAG: lysylphosphatidylglycerol synthase transmembrane domain-containing protein [Candidatus Aminicenantes bacterium]|nr:lysylphosphatidylglycerol synthase transmembrane domain-containing protein [Candidatus Aminicenantes bacterium]